MLRHSNMFCMIDSTKSTVNSQIAALGGCILQELEILSGVSGLIVKQIGNIKNSQRGISNITFKIIVPKVKIQAVDFPNGSFVAGAITLDILLPRIKTSLELAAGSSDALIDISAPMSNAIVQPAPGLIQDQDLPEPPSPVPARLGVRVLGPTDYEFFIINDLLDTETAGVRIDIAPQVVINPSGTIKVGSVSYYTDINAFNGKPLDEFGDLSIITKHTVSKAAETDIVFVEDFSVAPYATSVEIDGVDILTLPEGTDHGTPRVLPSVPNNLLHSARIDFASIFTPHIFVRDQSSTVNNTALSRQSYFADNVLDYDGLVSFSDIILTNSTGNTIVDGTVVLKVSSFSVITEEELI